MSMALQQPKYDLSDLIESGEYWAGIVDSGKAHITEDGESICGIVFPRNNPKRSKQEGGLGPRRKPENRKPWKRWEGLEDIPEDYDLCGMCQQVRLGQNPTTETADEIASDVRELLGIGGEGIQFTKAELRQVRSLLRENYD